MPKKIIKKLRLELSLFQLGFIAVILASILASLPLFKPGYFFMHDDVQVMRLLEMEKCFQDGQIPCRWVPDMGASYGHPLFNYHPVLAYYVGMFFRLFGLSFITISKLLFFLTYLLSGLFMYLLVNALFLNPFAAVTAAVFFIFAPYHAVDVYVRGAMTESWGIVFFPAIFFSLFRLSQNPKNPFYFALTAGSLSGLFLAHNIMTLLFTPIALLWGLYWFVINKQVKRLPYLISSFVIGVGLAAFFLLPAFLEKSLVKIDTLTSDYYNYRLHYASVRQLFLDRSWGFGPSQPGPEDKLSFQLGWPHWWIAFAGIITSVYLYLKKKYHELYIVIFAAVLYLGAIAMTHSKSVYLWDQITLIAFVQFPWRFLGIAMFAGGILAAALFALVSKKYQLHLAIFLSLLIIALNLGYFRVDQYDPTMTDEKKLSGEQYRVQAMATLMDYMPTQVKEYPKQLAPSEPWTITGGAKVTEWRKRSNFWRFTVENNSNEPSSVRIPIFNFPNWTVLLNQQPIEFKDDNDFGLIEVVIPPGKYTVVGRFENTSLRSVANMITIASFSILVLYLVLADRTRVLKKG